MYCMKNIIFQGIFGELTSGSLHMPANTLGNLIFHINNMLSPVQCMIYDYTQMFETVSFFRTSIHCNIKSFVIVTYRNLPVNLSPNLIVCFKL